jgi:hypothetical protein
VVSVCSLSFAAAAELSHHLLAFTTRGSLSRKPPRFSSRQTAWIAFGFLPARHPGSKSLRFGWRICGMALWKRHDAHWRLEAACAEHGRP